MKHLFLIGLGGGLGAICRHQLSSFILVMMGNQFFPWSTFSINVIGSSICGLILSYLSYKNQLFLDYKFFTITGFLGGFTTFSTFSLDLFMLIKTKNISMAFVYGCSSVFISLLGFFLGYSFFHLDK